MATTASWEPSGGMNKYTNGTVPFVFMANGISGKVDNRNINDILKDVWQKYDDWLNNGNTGVFRYEINP